MSKLLQWIDANSDPRQFQPLFWPVVINRDGKPMGMGTLMVTPFDNGVVLTAGHIFPDDRISRWDIAAIGKYPSIFRGIEKPEVLSADNQDIVVANVIPNGTTLFRGGWPAGKPEAKIVTEDSIPSDNAVEVKSMVTGKTMRLRRLITFDDGTKGLMPRTGGTSEHGYGESGSAFRDKDGKFYVVTNGRARDFKYILSTPFQFGAIK